MQLFLTEKSSQVDALKQVMGLKKDGKMAIGTYKGEMTYVVPLAGHIMRLKNFDEFSEMKQFIKEIKYNKNGKQYKKKILDWSKLVENNKIPFIPSKHEKIVKSKAEGKRTDGKKVFYTDYPSIYKNIADKIKKADKIYLAPDPDNEGVTLAMEVIDSCNASHKVIGLVRMNKLEPSSLKKELEKIDKNHYKNMYNAGNLRGEYDWAFGLNLSVAATILLSKGTTLHLGAVKLPTIRLVVERDLQFEKFETIKFYNVKCRVKFNNSEFDVIFNTKYEKEDNAKKLMKAIEETGYLIVNTHSESNKTKQPPLPYTLNKLQSTANRKYGMQMDEVSKIAQKLYERKVQSYPRSDCEYYSSGLFDEVPDIMKNLSKHKVYKDYISNLHKPYRKNRSFNDKQVDKHSHTALAPTTVFASNLSSNEFKVYDLVAKRFIIQFMDLYKYLSITGNTLFKIDGENIEGKWSENITIDEGWMSLERSGELKKNRTIPELKRGDKLTVIKSEIVEGETKPKPRFNDASLLEAMEKIERFYDDELIKKELKDIGIGTSATREPIIKDLIRGGYFTRKGKQIISTDKARQLIDILPDRITSPILRAEMESKLQEILDQSITPSSFRSEIKNIVQKAYNDLVSVSKSGKRVNATNSLNKVSPKMKQYAKSLAERNGIKLSRSDLSDPKKLSDIINRYKGVISLSPKQRYYIEKNGNSNIKKYLTKDNLTKEEYDEIQKWIKDQFNNRSYSLTDKQKDIIEKIGDDSLITLSRNIKLSKEEYDKLNKAISDYFKKSKKQASYTISDKQKALILNDKNRAPKTIKTLANKKKLTKEEFDKVKKWLDKLFKSFNK